MSADPDYDRDDVKARTDLVELAQTLGGKVYKEANGKVMMPCFLHGGDKPTSMVLDLRKGLWRCWTGCDEGGDVIRLVERAHNLDFKDALVWLGNHVGARPRGAAGDWRSRPKATPQTAPARQSVSPHAQVMGKSPCAARFRILGALWDILEGAPVGPDTADYLERRLPNPDGGGPRIARAIGCRDWSTRADEICALVESTPVEDLQAAGLAREDGRLWAPLRALQSHTTGSPEGVGGQRGSHRMAGIGVPVWWPGTAAPMAWRWRYLRPQTLKSQAMFTVGNDTPPAVLGLRTPAHIADGPWLPPVADAPALVIAEGEPDWWTLTQAAAALPDDVRPAVVAVCNAGWCLEWAPLLLRDGKARPVLVTAHDSSAGDKTARGVRDALVATVGASEARRVYARAPFAEDLDANDTHRRDGLGSITAMLMEWTTMKIRDFDADASPEELAELEEAERAKPRSPLRSLEGEGGQPVGADWLVGQPPRIEWFLVKPSPSITTGSVVTTPPPSGIMPMGTVGMLNAPGGSGKTFALTQLAVAAATGGPWFGAGGWQVASQPGRPARVFLGIGEEDRHMVRRRLHKALVHQAQSTGVDFEMLAKKAGENIVVPPFRGMGIALMDREGESLWAGELSKWLSDNGPWSLIILDPLSRWGGP